MQNLYTYTKYFQPSEVYDKSFHKKFNIALGKLSKELYLNPPKETTWDSMLWEFPYHKKYSNDYYNIIYIFADLCRVKVMYKDYLDGITYHPQKGLEFFGDRLRIKIMGHLMGYFFRGYFNYEQWIKNNLKEDAKKGGYKDIRVYTSDMLTKLRDRLYNFIKFLLENDLTYQHRLENYILEQVKLDVKGFSGNRSMYYHVTSKTYYHRRMLI